MKLRNLKDILSMRLAKRGVSLKALEFGSITDAAESTLRQEANIVCGISHEKAKSIIKDIKGLGLKVQPSLQGDQVRVAGKKKDDLQVVITTLQNRDYSIPLQFVNFR